MANKEQKGDILGEQFLLQEELRHARSALKNTEKTLATLAKKLDAQILENVALEERARCAHNQMRLMRNSSIWKAGGALRLGKRLVGKASRNIAALLGKS